MPFPAHYPEAAASEFCRPIQVPRVGGVQYESLCSDLRWYQRLDVDVLCLASRRIPGKSVDLVAVVQEHLQAAESITELLGEKRDMTRTCFSPPFCCRLGVEWCFSASTHWFFLPPWRLPWLPDSDLLAA